MAIYDPIGTIVLALAVIVGALLISLTLALFLGRAIHNRDTHGKPRDFTYPRGAPEVPEVQPPEG